MPTSQRTFPVSSRCFRNDLTAAGVSPFGSTETAMICMLEGSFSPRLAAPSACSMSGQTSGQCEYTNVR